MNSIWNGFRQFYRGLPLLGQARIWPPVVVPGLLSLAYVPVLLFVGWTFLGAAAAYVTDHWLPGALDVGVVRWLVLAILWVAALYLGFNLYRSIVMILYSPVLGTMSVRTEQAVFPDRFCPEPKVSLVESAVRGTSVSLLSLSLELASLVLCWMLLLIPVIGGLLMLVLLPLSQMFLAGQGFLDPALERRGFGVVGSFRFAWRHRGRAVGTGAGFVLLTFVPVIGWILGPPLGVIAGTLSVGDLLPSEQKPDNLGEIAP
jgi:uncharacterized protein involved in cysteine biosynthesis